MTTSSTAAATDEDDDVLYIERTYDSTKDDDHMYRTSPKLHYHNNIDYDIDTTTTTTTTTSNRNTNRKQRHSSTMTTTTPTTPTTDDLHYYHWPITPSLPTFGGGREDGRPMRYEAFFTITNVDNVILSGTTSTNTSTTSTSTIDGNGLIWWKLYSDRMHHHTYIPYTRPSLLEIRHSTNVQVYNIQLTQSPFWTMHMYNSSYLSIHQVHIYNDVYGYDIRTNRTYSSANVDGMDINSCHHVTIHDCHIQTHDDGIVIKSGLDLAGLRTHIPSHHIYVYNCYVHSPIGAGLGIGSEVSGGVSDIYFNNITIYGSMYGVRIKTFHGRGSYIRNVVFTNLHFFDNTNQQYGPTSVIMISMFGGDRPHLLRGYHWDDITMIENITFTNITMYDDPFVSSNSSSNNIHDHDNDPVAISSLLSRLISQRTTDTEDYGNHDENPVADYTSSLSSRSRIQHDARGIHIMGDTNLRRYWWWKLHYNDYIRNISFQQFQNFITVPPQTTAVTGTRSKKTKDDDDLRQVLQNFDCINAIHISYNDYTNIECSDQPYIMFTYDFDQLKRAIYKLFH
jgi:hypothetical protein